MEKDKSIKPLKIIIGEETHPIIENIEGKDTSLFAELYDKTFTCVEKYLQVINYGIKADNNLIDKAFKTDYPNNIIAFIGERGSGKTSCMLSVADMLQSEKGGVAFSYYEKLKQAVFTGISVIEPSFINDNANVLELVIATLFKKFKEKVKNGIEDKDSGKKHTLLELFQQVQENLKYLKNGTSDLDTIDSLLQLSSGVDLKANLKALIDSYLEFMNGTRQSILLLAIDDIDLNTKYAYAMVEQIRKYLILPNVLILVSLKLDQLEQVLRNDFSKQFESLQKIQKGSNNSVKNNIQEESPLLYDIQQMAERYVQKLIPLEHRVFMPDMDAAMELPYVVYDNLQQSQESFEGDCAKYANDESKILKHQILASIFEKTRFLFYNTKGKASYIIPRNLREFRNLVALLHNLPDYKGDYRGNCYNKTIFKKYFYGTWCENNLSLEKNILFSQITNVQDAVDINATVLNVLRGVFVKNMLYDERKNELMNVRGDEYKNILSRNNYKWNISLGDVMALLNYYEGHSLSMDDLKFIFALKTHYSIKLYEYYDELTVDEDDTIPLVDNDINAYDVHSTAQIFKKDYLYGHSNYAKLVGGSFINSGIVKLLPYKGRELVSRSQKVINFSIILEMVKNLTDYFDSLPKDLKSLSEVENKKMVQKRKELQLIEFFLLLSSRKNDSKNESSSEKYREDNEIWYSTDLSGLKTNIWFDITSCFYNCIDILATYKRIIPKFVDLVNGFDELDVECLPQNKSLFSQIANKCVQNRPKNNKRHSCYSQFAIRNTEVLDDLVSDRSTDTDFGNKEDKVVYSSFFGKLSSYCILTYDHAEGNYFSIDFTIYEIIKAFLDSFDEDLNAIFQKIMDSSEEFKCYAKDFPNKSYTKETIIKKILKKNPNFPNQTRLLEILNNIYVEKSYIREDIVKRLPQISQQLNDQN